MIGKVWVDTQSTPVGNNLIAYEVDPDRKNSLSQVSYLTKSSDIKAIYGTFAVRTTGRFAKVINEFHICAIYFKRRN